MAEFEIIGDEKVGDEEMDDATRAFLEEEQAALAAMGIQDTEFDGEGGDDDDFGGFEGDVNEEAHEEAGGDNSNPFGDSEPQQYQHQAAADGFGDDDFTGGDFGESSHHDAGMGNYDEGLTNGDAFGMADGSEAVHDEGFDEDPYAAIGKVDEEMAEPESVRKWREDLASRIAEVDAHSAEKKAEMLAKAKEDLDTFYTNYDAQLAKSRAANREQQAAQEEAREKPTGSDWEQTCNMLDFNPKAQVGNRDKSRMRSLLLGLKQQPLVR